MLSNVVRNAQNTSCLSIDNDRRSIHRGESNAAVTSDIARLKTFRLAIEGHLKTLPTHVAILFVSSLEEAMPNHFFLRVTSHVEHRLVAPLVTTFFIKSVDGFAGALHDVVQERLTLARDGFSLSQLRQITRRRHGAHCLTALIVHRFNCHQHWTIEVQRYNFQVDAARFAQRLFDNTSGAV